MSTYEELRDAHKDRLERIRAAYVVANETDDVGDFREADELSADLNERASDDLTEALVLLAQCLGA